MVRNFAVGSVPALLGSLILCAQRMEQTPQRTIPNSTRSSTERDPSCIIGSLLPTPNGEGMYNAGRESSCGWTRTQDEKSKKKWTEEKRNGKTNVQTGTKVR